MPKEIFISVDIETAGPIPGEYAMLSIGACLVADPGISFYRELQPDRDKASPAAMAINDLSMEALKARGEPPRQTMQEFSDWVRSVAPEGSRAVFVAFNAPFDWMFINDYFHRYLGENPFGHSALDIKAYFMGQAGVDWEETSFAKLAKRFLEERHISHNALKDAQDQAEIFQAVLNQSWRKRKTK